MASRWSSRARPRPLEFVGRLRDKILEVARRRSGGALDSEVKGENMRNVGDLIYHMLWEDRIFEEALMNPVALALITYLLGENCLIQSVTGQIKVQTAERTTLHSDNGMIPSPFPPYAQVANATWVLSEYTKANGCLLMVPGSHRHARIRTRSRPRTRRAWFRSRSRRLDGHLARQPVARGVPQDQS